MENNYETLKHICENRKSTRQFSNQEVTDETLKKIIAIAKTSPYASGLKNWEIQTVTSKKTISELADCVKQNVQNMLPLLKEDMLEYFINYSKSFSFFENAPSLIIPTFRISPIMAGLTGNKLNMDLLQWERDNFTKSISCVSMLILLAAESLGLGACYMTGPLIAQNSIMKIINSKPGREIGAIIPIGYKN